MFSYWFDQKDNSENDLFIILKDNTIIIMSEVKRGMLKYYHRKWIYVFLIWQSINSNHIGGLLNKKWKEYKFILYDSSLLTWYADIKHKKPDGMALLKVIFSIYIFLKWIILLSGCRTIYLCRPIYKVISNKVISILYDLCKKILDFYLIFLILIMNMIK